MFGLFNSTAWILQMYFKPPHLKWTYRVLVNLLAIFSCYAFFKAMSAYRCDQWPLCWGSRVHHFYLRFMCGIRKKIRTIRCRKKSWEDLRPTKPFNNSIQFPSSGRRVVIAVFCYFYKKKSFSYTFSFSKCPAIYIFVPICIYFSTDRNYVCFKHPVQGCRGRTAPARSYYTHLCHSKLFKGN